MSRSALLCSSAALAILFAAPALASPRPAVSAINGKLEAVGGHFDQAAGWALGGALSVPLSPGFGAQLDVIAGTAGGNPFGGVAGHAFWRDPRQGLIGVYASTVRWPNIGAEVNKAGFEGQLYAGRLSLEGLVSMQTGAFTGFSGGAVAAYYLNDNLRVDGGFRQLQGVGTAGTVGVEYQHDRTGFALFANASFNGTDYTTLFGGLRFYQGPPKALINRHREDDPGISMLLDLFQTCTVPLIEVLSIDGICSIRTLPD